MPFRQATALVTVEREGVIDSFVQPLSGSAPVIKVPLKGNYAPNVFVSVLVVRGRISDVQPTALVDLGKPAFKMGIAEINVGWRAHELGVKVSTDKGVYKVRDKAHVSIQVTQRAGGRRRAANRARTVRHLVAMESKGAARREGARERRHSAQRFPDVVSHHRGGR